MHEKYNGLHEVCYISDTELNECKDEIIRLYARVKALGYTVNPLEMLAMSILKVNHLIGEKRESI